MKDNKPCYEKVYIWIGIIAGICAILGISIFDGKSIFRNNQTDTTSINFENNEIGDQTTVIIGYDNTLNYESTNSENMKNSQPSDYEDEKTSSRYHKGTITKTGWESKFIGLRYTNPEGMNMLTEEELDEMNKLESGISTLIFDPDELGYTALTTVFEMISKTEDQSIIVGVCVERFFDDIDISQFIEGYESQIVRNPFTIYELISDKETVKIGNEDYILVSYIMESNNDFNYMDNYVRLIGDRATMITIIFDDESARDNILDAFTAY